MTMEVEGEEGPNICMKQRVHNVWHVGFFIFYLFFVEGSTCIM